MAKLTSEFIRRAYLGQFAKMQRASQDAVIEALEVVRDCTNPAPADNGASVDEPDAALKAAKAT